ncbi:MAG: endonuclease [Chloroflexi bacterium]|nr:endonuclease [Chloroflexota bacterium]
MPQLQAILARLDRAYDFPAWHWQAHTPPDYVCISAVLVQHTSWSNVERALARLAAADKLSLRAIDGLGEEELAALVRPAGTPSEKARRLLALAALAREQGGLERLLDLPAAELRERLLATRGIGPETADAVLLNAAGRAVFQVDAYARRLVRRLGLGPDSDGYETWQRWFESALPPDAEAYRRWHGLIVLHGKQTCRPRPKCAECCLLDVCPTGQRTTAGRTSG